MAVPRCYGSHAQASIRTPGLASHCRMRPHRERHPSPRRGRPRPHQARLLPCRAAAGLRRVKPMAFRWPKASLTKSVAALSPISCAQPSFDITSAIASNITDGVPASWPSASSDPAALQLHPADLWRHDLDGAALAFHGLQHGLDQCAVRTVGDQDADARPCSVGEYLPTMRNAGDSSMSCASTAASDFDGKSTFKPLATRAASVSSTLPRLASTRSRTC